MNKEILVLSIQDLKELMRLKENYKIIDININKDFNTEGVPFLQIKIQDLEKENDSAYEGMQYSSYFWRYDKLRYKIEI